MSGSRSAARRLLRCLCDTVPVRGRHRLIGLLGRCLGDDRELVDVGGLQVEIDHAVSTCRHMYYGIYEEHLVRWIARNIRPGDAIIEPGANIGYITGRLLAALNGNGTLLSLEPSRHCIDQLRRNNDLNAIGNLRLMHAAIATRPGSETFWETPQIISAGYGYLQPANWDNSSEGERYTIQTHNVDELMQEHGLSRLAFLKLDVEGSEVPALQGAQRAIARQAIDHIMVETYVDKDDPRSVTLVDTMCDLLESSGYRPHSMRRNGTIRPVELRASRVRKWRSDIMWAKR
jgi:FkbM family methyltransferase